MCGGGIYIGGCKGNVSNTTIKNNETIFGGGLGVASSRTGEGGILFSNIVIENNIAKFGGAVSCHSLVGQPITFVNGLFKNNKSTEGSSFYCLVYAFFNGENSGGLIQILFSSFFNNEANDNNTFGFYRKDETKGEIGTIDIKGSILIGEDKYLGDNSYNYENTLAKALEEKAIDNEYNVIKNGPSDIKVKRSVYKTWSDGLSNYHSTLNIGYGNNLPLSDKTMLFIITGVILLVIIIVPIIVLLIIRNHKNKVNNTNKNEDNNNTITEEENNELDSLTERELSVAYYLVNLKKRKEIAEIINYSEETVKKDLSSIYLKLNVKGKSELIVKYGNKISEYFEKKLS